MRWQTDPVAQNRYTGSPVAKRGVGKTPAPVRGMKPRISTLSAIKNLLIERLPAEDRERLLAVSEPVELKLSQLVCKQGDPSPHVYFPTSGFISLVVKLAAHPSIEVGMVGNEGMLGTQLVLGVETSPLTALVQGPGLTWRIDSEDFHRELACSAALQRALLRYISLQIKLLATSNACIRFHRIEPRLARWLLMSQDRAHADRFQVTHEFLACMLGVRRVSITAAAGALQSSGLIEYHRGALTVRDRDGLKAAACSCYAADRLAYRNLWDR